MYYEQPVNLRASIGNDERPKKWFDKNNYEFVRNWMKRGHLAVSVGTVQMYSHFYKYYISSTPCFYMKVS